MSLHPQLFRMDWEKARLKCSACTNWLAAAKCYGMSDSHSASDLLALWADGEESAAELLFRRYAERLCVLAESNLSGKIRQRVGPEDIVQSVFRTFFSRARSGSYSIDHSGALWRLLVTITLNKIRRQVEFHQAGVRSVNSETSEPAEFLSREVSLEEAAALTDELDNLFNLLHPPEPTILKLRLEGLSIEQIAEHLAVTRWTVRRTLSRIGVLLQQRLRDES